MEKLFGHELKYNVDEANRTVVAFFNAPCQDDVWEQIMLETVNNLGCPVDISPIKYDVVDKIIAEYPKKNGRSRCIESDEFDVEEGKRIAREQLRGRLIRAKYRIVDEIDDKAIKMFDKYLHKCNNLLVALDKEMLEMNIYTY